MAVAGRYGVACRMMAVLCRMLRLGGVGRMSVVTRLVEMYVIIRRRGVMAFLAFGETGQVERDGEHEKAGRKRSFTATERTAIIPDLELGSAPDRHGQHHQQEGQSDARFRGHVAVP